MSDDRTALIVGASRALGRALAEELLSRGWRVIGTVRGQKRTELHDVADRSGGRLEIEHVDMTEPDDVLSLRERLSGRSLDLLFVNAGIAHADIPSHEVSTESFTQVMITNALSPLRVIEALGSLVTDDGTIGVMSSSQGSVSLNTNGGNEVYRASKSALNQLMRSYAARHAEDTRTVLLINPGWVRTDLGGSGAALAIGESIPGVADAIESHIGAKGLHFLDYRNDVVPW